MSHRFVFPTEPKANEEAVVHFKNARFTVLESRSVRCEYNPAGEFCDQPSQHIWFRKQEVPSFEVEKTEGQCRIVTNNLILNYDTSKGEKFNDENLTICSRTEDGIEWHYGKKNEGVLPGTLRTLDHIKGVLHMNIDKKASLSESYLSRNGWSVIDDSSTLVFNEKGLLEGRKSSGQDLYFLGFGKRFKECLKFYYQIAGEVPLPPKRILGLWWSRWCLYKDQDLLQIIREFEEHGVPLSVCVVDMDWHIVKNGYHSGWTGYTWNKDYFPEPEKFLGELHEKGILSCLNVHPHEGVAPHETRYEEFLAEAGKTENKGEVIPFSLKDEDYLKAYFKCLHEPLEDQGIDFWWIDWQQGEEWDLPGVDPLWYLNHLHALKISRGGKKRPLIFSRWGDHGSHRYPTGFSGDTYSTWDTLAFLPEFMALSANLGYPWRNDETGGFQRGNHKNQELFTRWNQMAAFSPVYRLHNCGDPTLDYRPWSKSHEYQNAILDAMKLRKSLEPYIYSAAHNIKSGEVLCRPMYHDYPECEEAYLCPQQYMFGPDLIVAPFTNPAEKSVGLARQVVWLPEGEWYDFFSSERFEGGRFYPVYGGIDRIPVFVRSGAAIPLLLEGKKEWLVFPGDGESCFYDDDGVSMSYEKGDFLYARLSSRTSGGGRLLKLESIEGAFDVSESFRIRFGGYDSKEYEDKTIALGEEVMINHLPEVKDHAFTSPDFERLLHSFQLLGHTTRPLIGKLNVDYFPGDEKPYDHLGEILQDFRRFIPYQGDFTLAQKRCLCELITGCGFHCQTLFSGDDALYYWNHHHRDQWSVSVSIREDFTYDHLSWSGETSHAYFLADNTSRFTSWEASCQYRFLYQQIFARENRYVTELI